MFPGFATIYKDKEGFVHLYFFPGVDMREKPVYRSIDLSNIAFDYTYVKNADGSFDYKFKNKKIVRMKCKLIRARDGKMIQKTLEY